MVSQDTWTSALNVAIFLSPIAYVVTNSVLLILIGVHSISDILNIVLFATSCISTVSATLIRHLLRKTSFKFKERYEYNGISEKLGNEAVLLGTAILISFLAFFPWAHYFSSANLDQIQYQALIILCIVGTLWSTVLIYSEFYVTLAIYDILHTAAINTKKSQKTAIEVLGTTQDSDNYKSRREVISLGISDAEDDHTAFTESLRTQYVSERWDLKDFKSNECVVFLYEESSIIDLKSWFKRNDYKLAGNSNNLDNIIRLRNFLHDQFLIYAFDFLVSVVVVSYIIYYNKPYNTLTIQLTTMASIPVSLSIINMVVFNSYITQIEDGLFIKTNWKIGFGLTMLFGTRELVKFSTIDVAIGVRNFLYYEPDAKAVFTLIFQVIWYLLKSFSLVPSM